MDKEAQKKMAKALYERFFISEQWEEASAPAVDYFWSIAHRVLTTIKELGYRKQPKEKPPLLSATKQDEIINLATKLTNPMPLVEVMKFGGAIAQAQWDIWNKAIYEG